MMDSRELIERLGGDIERIFNSVSGNAGEYKYTVLRESVIQDCEECGHETLGVIRVDAAGGAKRYYYIGYCRRCYHVQNIVKGPFRTVID